MAAKKKKKRKKGPSEPWHQRKWAKAAGLWNFWLTDSEKGLGLTTVEYAYFAEEMGKTPMGAEVFNCNAPDTGNMEVIERFGTEADKERWLKPLLAGEIRSCFAMTEPAVASSDATNIQGEITRDGDEYVINGSKIWTTHAHHAQWIFALTRTNPEVKKQAGITFLLVPMDQPGVEVSPIVSMSGDHEVNQVFFSDARTGVANLGYDERRRLNEGAKAAIARACQ